MERRPTAFQNHKHGLVAPADLEYQNPSAISGPQAVISTIRNLTRINSTYAHVQSRLSDVGQVYLVSQLTTEFADFNGRPSPSGTYSTSTDRAGA